MNAITLIAVAVATALLGLPAGAGAEEQGPCCKDKKPCCETQMLSCCDHRHETVAAPIRQPDVDKRPTVERMVVRFWNPVLVGDRILVGKYVIEHDTNRMARGRPCTYIYNYDDRRLPVVAFHCTHLTRARRAQPTVTVVATSDPVGLKRFTEFQFAGESAGHGVPVVR